MRPESKTESHYLIDIEEAPYLVNGQQIASYAKQQIQRERRRHSRRVIQEQFTEYLYDS
jgi:hypothetical protein